MTDPGSNPNRNEHLMGYMFHDAIIVTVNDRDAQRIHARAVEIFATFDDTPSTCGLIFCCGCADNGDVEHCERPASPTQETP